MKNATQIAILGSIAAMFAMAPESRSATIVDGGFENLTGLTAGAFGVEAAPGSYGSWTVASAPQSNLVYVTGGGSGAPGAQDGANYVALQQYEVDTYSPAAVASISQTVPTFSLDTQYTLTWHDAARTAADGGLAYEVLLNGTQAFTTTPANSGWEQRSITFTATATDYTIAFHVLDNGDGGLDQTTFIDNVNLVSVPEPGSMALAGMALLGALSIRRRR